MDALDAELKKLGLAPPQQQEVQHAGLAAGVHEFPFEFKLPAEGLYTSFDAKNAAGFVRYYIIVHALSGGHAVLKRKLLFPVVCPRDLAADAELAKLACEPINVEATHRLEK